MIFPGSIEDVAERGGRKACESRRRGAPHFQLTPNAAANCRELFDFPAPRPDPAININYYWRQLILGHKLYGPRHPKGWRAASFAPILQSKKLQRCSIDSMVRWSIFLRAFPSDRVRLGDADAGKSCCSCALVCNCLLFFITVAHRKWDISWTTDICWNHVWLIPKMCDILLNQLIFLGFFYKKNDDSMKIMFGCVNKNVIFAKKNDVWL